MYKYIILLLSFIFASCGGNLILTKQDFTPPSVKNQPRLLYPKNAQENSYTGSTKVIMIISESGTVSKANIVESSGSDILDSAAVKYCRNLLFYPAKRNDKPVYSRMEMNIKFDLSGQAWDAKNYVSVVQDCYRRIKQLNLFVRKNVNGEKNEVENRILGKHDEFVQNMTDVINFNFYVEQVISSGLAAEWKEDWNSWPLSFLLYHDFIQRFGDYDSLSSVKIRLRNSLKEDFQFIKSSAVYTAEEQSGREKLLQKINKFVADNYPDISFEAIDPI